MLNWWSFQEAKTVIKMSENNINQKFNFSDFLKQNKLKIISVSSLSIISIVLFFVFNEMQEKKNIEISENFNKAKILIEKNNNDEAIKVLDKIVKSKNKFYSASALNLIIDKKLFNDKDKILEYFDLVISSSNLDEEIKDLFIIKKIFFLGDEINESELLNNLKPIITSNSIWKNTAQDYIKKYYLSKNEFSKAKEFENLTK